MKGFVCKVCAFTAIDGGVPEKCPVCGAPRAAFQEKEDAVKTAADKNNLTELEKKHIPVITIVKTCGLFPDGCEDARIKIGEITHPMQPAHYIVHIDVYIDKKFISRIILTADKLQPAVALHLRKQEGVLSVVELCNLHGAWFQETAL